MAKKNDTYLVTLGKDFTGSIKELVQDIADLAFVGCEPLKVAINRDWTLDLGCSETFAKEVANTQGIAQVQSKTSGLGFVVPPRAP